MLFVNEKLLRFVLVIAGIGTLAGFAWKMVDFIKNQDTINKSLDIKALEGSFGGNMGPKDATHLKPYADYAVLQELNITGYVEPIKPEDNEPVVARPVLVAEDIEVPMIQSPSMAWIQARGETSSDDKIVGDFLVVGDTFELATKAGLKLRLKSVQPGWVEIEIVDSGELLKVYASTYEVDADRVFVGSEDVTKPGAGEGATYVNPTITREVEPNSYAVGQEDVSALQSMSQEEILSSVPHRVYRDPMSNEVVGLRIKSVPPNSIFERLGLRADDIVLEVNGQAATDRDQLFESIRKLDTDTLNVRIERLGGIRTLTYRLPK